MLGPCFSALVFACLSPALAAEERDSDRDGLSDAEETRLGLRPMDPDYDDDGLLDGWEVNGYRRNDGYEPLPAYGADPFRKDVFVEIDWMASAEGSTRENAIIAYQAAVDAIKVFRRSGTGIEIHFDLGPRIESHVPEEILEKDFDFSAFAAEPDAEKVLPYQIRFPARPVRGSDSSGLSLYDIYYGGRFFRPSRRNLFYYAVIVEAGRPGLLSGEISSNPTFVDAFSDELARTDGLRDAGVHLSLVSRLPSPDLPPEIKRYHYSVSLLHELGHAFGLGHGGSRRPFVWDNNNYKPNYASLMNYHFQYCGVDAAGEVPIMDFSPKDFLHPLSERHVVEADGLGREAPEHLLDCLGVSSLPVREHPRNLDWNKDGYLSEEPLIFDLNGNGIIDDLPHADHDDWGKFQREGFEGIGLKAFGGCGMSCGWGDEIVQVFGDYNGDGTTDIFLARGNEIGWALASGSGELAIDPASNRSGSMGRWSFTAGQNLLAGDWFAIGRDMIFCHALNEVVIIDHGEGTPRLVWYEDVTILRGGPEPAEGWRISPADRFLPVKLSESALDEIVVTDGRDVGVLSAAGLEAGEMVAGWTAGEALLNWTRGENASVREGRALRGGKTSFFIESASALVEVVGPLGNAGVFPLEVDGVVPPEGGAREGWTVSSEDVIDVADLDGDGIQEVLLRAPERLGLVRWVAGSPRLVWSAEERIGDAWTLSERDRLHHGDLAPRQGKEVLLSSGDAWLVLGWNPESRVLETLGGGAGKVQTGTHFTIRSGQRILLGRFVPGTADAILAYDAMGLAIARFDPDSRGFRGEVAATGMLGEWTFGAGDELSPANADGDPELEVYVRRGSIFGVIDFTPAPRSTFVVRLKAGSLEFENPARFRRGDGNDDGGVDISDAVLLLGSLFRGQKPPACLDAADADDSGKLNVTDALYLLRFLFTRGPEPLPPGPFAPGIDFSPDELLCPADRG